MIYLQFNPRLALYILSWCEAYSRFFCWLAVRQGFVDKVEWHACVPREGNIGVGVEPSLLSDGDVETALPYLVFHIAFVLFAQVVEYFAQQEPQSPWSLTGVTTPLSR